MHAHVCMCVHSQERDRKTDGKKREDTGQGRQRMNTKKKNVFLVSAINSGISKSKMP